MSIVVLKLPDVKRKTEERPKRCPYCKGETFQRWGRVSKPVKDVRVDQPRQENVTAEVEDFVGGLWQVGGFANLLDETVANKKTTIRELGLVVVHGEQMGVFDEKGGHIVC